MKVKAVSELIDGLTSILEGQANTRITDNMPHTPTAILYAGDKAFEARGEMMATLRRVWRGRADDLCQLVHKEEGYFAPGGDGALVPITESEVQERIDEMFAREHSFRSMNGLVLCAVINTADYQSVEEFRKAYLLTDTLKEKLAMSSCSSMKIVLLDESGKGKALAVQIRAYLRELLDGGDLASLATVILSNRLKNGVLLAGSRIRENYSLAGNLLLLANGSNKDFSPKFSAMFPLARKQFLTSSYSCISKPSQKICEILVNSTLAWLDNRFNKGQHLTVDDISKQLEITGGTMKILDRYFQQNVVDSLPKNTALEHLPRNCENPEMLANVPFAEFDRITMGSFELFYKEAVVDACTAERNKRLFRDTFMSQVQALFTPSEAASSITAQTIEQVLKQIRCDTPAASLPAYRYMLTRAKADCSEILIPVCEEVLKTVAGAAKNHIAQLSDIIQEFQHSYMLDVDDTLQQYYQALAQDKLENSLGKRLIDTFNKPGIDKAGMLDALYDTLSLLFTSEKIFSLPLEQEMTARIGGNGKQVQHIVQSELTDGLSDSVRLQTAIVPELAFETILVNQKDEDGNAATFYSYLSGMFTNADCLDTGNRNSIEFMQLYAIDAHTL